MVGELLIYKVELELELVGVALLVGKGFETQLSVLGELEFVPLNLPTLSASSLDGDTDPFPAVYVFDQLS